MGDRVTNPSEGAKRLIHAYEGTMADAIASFNGYSASAPAEHFSAYNTLKKKPLLPSVMMAGATVQQVFNILWADNRFMLEFREKRNDVNTTVTAWTFAAGAGEDSFAGVRNLTYITTVSAPLTTQTPVYESERYVMAGKALTVHMSTQTPDVTMGERFRIEVLLEFVESSEGTVMSTYWYINFIKSVSLLKGKIESTAGEGLKKAFTTCGDMACSAVAKTTLKGKGTKASSLPEGSAMSFSSLPVALPDWRSPVGTLSPPKVPQPPKGIDAPSPPTSEAVINKISMTSHPAVETLQAAAYQLEEQPLQSLPDLCGVLDSLRILAKAVATAASALSESSSHSAALPGALITSVRDELHNALTQIQFHAAGSGDPNRTGGLCDHEGLSPMVTASNNTWAPLDEASLTATFMSEKILFCKSCMEIRTASSIHGCPLHGECQPLDVRKFLHEGGGYPSPHIALRSLLPLIPHRRLVQCFAYHPSLMVSWRAEVTALRPPKNPCVVYCLLPGPLATQYSTGAVRRLALGATALSSLTVTLSLAHGRGPHTLFVIRARSCRFISKYSVRPQEGEVVFPDGALLVSCATDPTVEAVVRAYGGNISDVISFEEVELQCWTDLVPHVQDPSIRQKLLSMGDPSRPLVAATMPRWSGTTLLHALASTPTERKALELVGATLTTEDLNVFGGGWCPEGTPLECALNVPGNEESVMYLLRRGCEVPSTSIVDPRMWNKVLHHATSVPQPVSWVLLVLQVVAPSLDGATLQQCVLACARWGHSVLVDSLLRLPLWTSETRNAVLGKVALEAATHGSLSTLHLLQMWEKSCCASPEILAAAIRSGSLPCLEWVNSLGLLTPEFLPEAAGTGSVEILTNFLSMITPVITLLHQNEASPEWSAAVQRAVQAGNYNVVRTLLNHEAFPRATIGDMAQALRTALESGQDTSCLVAAGATLPMADAMHMLREAIKADNISVLHAVATFLPGSVIALVDGDSEEGIALDDTPLAIRMPLASACAHASLRAVCTMIDSLELLTQERGGRETVRIREVLCEDGATLAHYAACGGNTAVLEYLVQKHGVDLSKPDDFGDDVLCYACAGGHLKTVRYLLITRGIIPTARSLVTASEHGHVDVAEELLDRGIPIDSLCSRPQSVSEGGALALTLRPSPDKGKIPLSEVPPFPFVEDPMIRTRYRKSGWAALHTAAWFAQADMVTLLRRRGAALELCTSDGWTPLAIACLRGHVGIVTLLLEKVSLPLRIGGQILIPVSPPVGGADGGGGRGTCGALPRVEAMQCAVWCDRIDAVRELLAQGPRFHSPMTKEVSVFGWLTLVLAARQGSVPITEALLRVGTPVNDLIPFYEARGPALVHASYKGHLEVCKLLLSAGANASLGGSGGHTPLMAAAYAGRADIASLLLNAGARVPVRTSDSHEWDALAMAVAGGHLKVAQILMEKGAVPTKEHVRQSVTPSLASALERKVMWKPSESCEACANCGRGFTLTRRKHHCRTCGNVFCATCCPQVKSEGAVRRCQDCVKDCLEKSLSSTQGLELSVQLYNKMEDASTTDSLERTPSTVPRSNLTRVRVLSIINNKRST